MMRTGKGGVVKRNQLNVVFRDNGISGQAFVLQKITVNCDQTFYFD
jgi:hypothetical protein